MENSEHLSEFKNEIKSLKILFFDLYMFDICKKNRIKKSDASVPLRMAHGLTSEGQLR
jgi:hypothetical protein